MGNVNTDSSTILVAWNNITKAVTSIESTKESIARKYQKLDDGWTDKKYKELGCVVHECNRTLNSLLKILMKAEKSLSILVKSLQEYENTQLGSNSTDRTRTSFVEALQQSDFVRKKSEAEKMSDFKQGLVAIDQVIENYAENLENRGLSRGPVMNAILDYQRNMQQAELLRNLNGDFSHPVSTLTAADFDAIIENCRSRGWMNYSGTLSVPRSISVTRYGFSSQNINGTEMRVYNDPVGTNSLLIRQQGNSQYDMEGTCGLCQCSNILTMAGVTGSTEDSIISAAIHSSDDVLESMELFNSASEERGGTTVRNRQEILSRCGLQTYCLPVNSDRQETTRQLSEAIRTGHGVIVSVDVAYLWRNGQSGGHAISLISVSEDGNTFIYNDTGSGMMGIISARNLARALTGRPANVTCDIIR